MGRGRGLERLYFSMAWECVSDMCDRWASGVESGEQIEALGARWRLVELEAVSCYSSGRKRGRHEYQTAAACLIQPNSHARLQTTLCAAALIWQYVWECVFESVCEREKDRQYGSQGPTDKELFRHARWTHKHSNTLVWCRLRVKVSGRDCTARTRTHNICGQEKRHKVAMVTWRDSHWCTVIKQREKSHERADGQKGEDTPTFSLKNKNVMQQIFVSPQISLFHLTRDTRMSERGRRRLSYLLNAW